MRVVSLQVSNRGRSLRLVENGALLSERAVEDGAIANLVALVADRYDAPTRDLRSLGQSLFEWVDGPGLRWLAGLMQELRGDGFTLRIDVGEQLRHLPWELLADSSGFLAANIAVPFSPVRVVTDAGQPTGVANRPLRTLFMAASPLDTAPVLDYEAEEAQILGAAARSGLDLRVEESGTLDGIEQRLVDHGARWFDVVHLTGHAAVSLADGPHLLLEDEVGRASPATSDDLIRAFSGRWPRLLFLSGCWTGASTQSGLVPSLAEELVRAGAPCVLGWALPVGDQSATAAAASLYQHLGAGMAIDEAVGRTRTALIRSGSKYWHTLRMWADGSALGPLVTPLATAGRGRVLRRAAQMEFLDANAKSEVCPPERFVGRRRVIQHALRSLRALEVDPDHADGVVLYGMGGLGKSSTAARLCERMPDHRRVVLVGEIDELAVVRAVGERLGSAASDLINDSNGSLRSRLLDVLAATESPVLFVLDDFEQNLNIDGDGVPHLTSDGLALLAPKAVSVLGALLGAVHDSGFGSRLLATCRYRFAAPEGPASLAWHAIEGLTGADEAKKLSQLSGYENAPPDVQARMVEIGDGNPRLLEWLDRALSSGAVEPHHLFGLLEDVAAEFREQVLTEALLDTVTGRYRHILAVLAIAHVPVPAMALLEAGVGTEDEVEQALVRAESLGLIEPSVDQGIQRYRVPGIVRPLLQCELDDSARSASTVSLLRALQRDWLGGTSIEEHEALELHRLGMVVHDEEVVVAVSRLLAREMINRSRYREAKAVLDETFTLVQEPSLGIHLARANDVLGDVDAALAHLDAALTHPSVTTGERAAILHNKAAMLVRMGHVEMGVVLFEESRVLQGEAGEPAGQVATLLEMAGIAEREGDVARARALFEEALALSEQTEGRRQARSSALHEFAGWLKRQGNHVEAERLYRASLAISMEVGDDRARARTVHQLAGLALDAGDLDRATELFSESLALKEVVGDVRGRAATLHQLGVIVGRTDPERARELYEESLAVKERVGAVDGQAATLHQLGGLAVRRGDKEQAAELLKRAADLHAQAGNVLARLRSLHEYGMSLVSCGDEAGGLKVLEEVRDTARSIGDLPGLARSSAQLGLLTIDDPARAAVAFAEFVVHKEHLASPMEAAYALHGYGMVLLDDDDEAAQRHFLEAARKFAAEQRWIELARSLSAASMCTEDSVVAAQALWLMVTTSDWGLDAMVPAMRISQCVAPAHPLRALIALATRKVIATGIPDEAVAVAQHMLVVAGEEIGLTIDLDADLWAQFGVAEADLADRLRSALIALYPPDDWLFDPAAVMTP